MEWVIIGIAGVIFGWYLGGQLAGGDESLEPERPNDNRDPDASDRPQAG